jgi:PBP1b-binding outer membrane lipoprotein LpoB
MIRIAPALAVVALLGACSEGKVVSESESPRNEAVAENQNKQDVQETPGANSFTEAQARGHIESAGYTNVTELALNSDGLWAGKATRDGATVNVTVDYKGTITPSTTPPAG